MTFDPNAPSRRAFLAGSASAFGMGAEATAGDAIRSATLERLVRDTVEPVRAGHDIAGMAVAMTANGQNRIFNFGFASRETRQPVTDRTIFEIGSLTKVFTAALGALAETVGALSLPDMASRHLPALAGSSFDRISLLDLATYTPGGLPLQFPADVTAATMIDYFRSWQPNAPPGTSRQYSNPSIGLFGHAVAERLQSPFPDLIRSRILAPLGLENTFFAVPPARRGDYSFGYSRDGHPIRVNPGLLDAEAYGLKSTAADMIRFLEAQMIAARSTDDLGRALRTSHVERYRVGPMSQALGWEAYPYPVDPDTLTTGNSTDISLRPNPVLPRQSHAAGTPRLLNKTGSTNGFGAYAAFVPAKRIGIVVLANRNYPNAQRIAIAHRILAALT